MKTYILIQKQSYLSIPFVVQTILSSL